jgi:hypothetical protein
MKKMIIIGLLGFGFSGCAGIDAAFAEKLSGGYIYHYNEIGCPTVFRDSPSYKCIPNDVVDYRFDNNFIIASHKDCIDCIDCDDWGDFHLFGETELDFYIISHKKDSVYGPLTEKEYDNLRKELYVPIVLKLK